MESINNKDMNHDAKFNLGAEIREICLISCFCLTSAAQIFYNTGWSLLAISVSVLSLIILIAYRFVKRTA